MSAYTTLTVTRSTAVRFLEGLDLDDLEQSNLDWLDANDHTCTIGGKVEWRMSFNVTNETFESILDHLCEHQLYNFLVVDDDSWTVQDRDDYRFYTEIPEHWVRRRSDGCENIVSRDSDLYPILDRLEELGFNRRKTAQFLAENKP